MVDESGIVAPSVRGGKAFWGVGGGRRSPIVSHKVTDRALDSFRKLLCEWRWLCEIPIFLGRCFANAPARCPDIEMLKGKTVYDKHSVNLKAQPKKQQSGIQKKKAKNIPIGEKIKASSH